MAGVLKFKQTNVPRQNGEVARLKAVQGPDAGSVFVLTTTSVTIGRGEENDLIVMDLKSSRRHAQVSKTPSGRWHLKDMGSANGLVHNGGVTRDAPLRSGDTFALGETVFEFVVSEESQTRMLTAPAKQVPANFVVGKAPVAKPKPKPKPKPAPAVAGGGLAGLAGIGGASGGGSGDGSRKRILIIAVIGLGAWLYADDMESAKKKQPPTAAQTEARAKAAQEENDRRLASFMPPSASSDAAEMFFTAGFREFRVRNYLRAKQQFETALQISPTHRMALKYLRESEIEISNEVKTHIENGSRDMDAGRLRSAKGHFEAAIRLLYRDQSSDQYKNATAGLEAANKAMKGGGSG